MPLSKRLIRLSLSAILVLGLSPFPFQSEAFAEEDAAGTHDAEIDALLDGQEYVEGEAIAIVRADLSVQETGLDAILSWDLPGSTPDGEDLLSSGETLITASIETTKESLGIELEEASAAAQAAQADSDAAGDSVRLSAQDVAQDEAIEVVCVSRPDLTTRELLNILMNDARVVKAQPNYIYEISDESDNTLDEGSLDELTDSLAKNGSGDTEGTSDISEGTSGTEEDGAVQNNAASTASNAEGAQLASTSPQPVQEQGFTRKTTEGYDMTEWEWAYGSTSAFKRPNDTSSSLATMGISGWNTTDGKGNAEGTVVAVLDSGVDYTNPDLKNAIISGTNSDISQACGGGQYGYNSSGDDKGTSDSQDYNGHGTHCAGIIAASWNGYGTSGAADGVQILGVRGMPAGEGMHTTGAIRAYEYLCKVKEAGMNLVAVNNSWGSDYVIDYAKDLAITKLGKLGCISVWAAGNSDLDNDIHSSTTTTYTENPYEITVSSAKHTDTKSSFSSYGQASSNVFGAGSEIVSTVGRTEVHSCYGPADINPIYRNYFTNTNLADNICLIDRQKDAQGKAEYPTYDELTAGISANASRSTDASVDADTDAASLKLNSDSAHDYWLAIPVAADKVDSITSYGFHFYADLAEGESQAYAALLPVLKSTDGTEWRSAAINSTTYCVADGEWLVTNADIQSLIDATPSPSSGGTWHLDTIDIPGNDTTKLVLFQLITSGATADGGYYLDALSLHASYAITGTAGNWQFMEGTSMAAPSVAGCAAIAAKQSGLTGADLANYVKAHVRTVDDFADISTQGGFVDLSVAENQTTPVINKVRQDGFDTAAPTSTITISGAYFGNTQGTLTIGGKTATVTSWTNTQIVATVPSDVSSGTPVVAVTAANSKTGRFVMKYQAPSAGADQAKLFPETLASPDASPAIREESWSLVSGVFSGSDFITNRMVAVGGHIYLASLGSSEESFGTLYYYDIASNTWGIACQFSATLSYCSIAASNEKVYCFGHDGNAAPYMACYDPVSGTIQQIDATALGTGGDTAFVNATLTDADGTLMLIGGAQGNGTFPTANNIAELTITGGSLSYAVCGSLTPESSIGNGVSGAQAVYHNGALYVGAFLSQVPSTSAPTYTLCKNLYKLTKGTDGTWTPTDISSTLPEIISTEGNKTSQGYLPIYALTAISDGIVISGANVSETPGGTTRSTFDTYVLKDGASSFSAYEYSADLDVLNYPASVSVGGYLYTLGVEKLYVEEQGGEFVFRRAPMDVCTVSFDMQGHGQEVPSQTVEKGGTVKEPTPAPTEDGWTFKGWYHDKKCTTAWNFATDTVSGDTVTIYAGWEASSTTTASASAATGDSTAFLFTGAAGVLLAGMLCAAAAFGLARRKE